MIDCDELDYYDCELLDSKVMSASTIDVNNDLLKPEAPIEPIPSIASSLMRTVEILFLLIIGIIGVSLFAATPGFILLGIEKLLSFF